MRRVDEAEENNKSLLIDQFMVAVNNKSQTNDQLHLQFLLKNRHLVQYIWNAISIDSKVISPFLTLFMLKDMYIIH